MDTVIPNILIVNMNSDIDEECTSWTSSEETENEIHYWSTLVH